MNWLTRHIPGVLFVLIFSVVVQLTIYGLFILNLNRNDVFIVILILIAFGFLATLVIKEISIKCFYKNTTKTSWIETIVEQQSQSLGIGKPQITFSDSAGINAFALGNLTGGGVLVVQQELLRQLTQDEIESVVAHENSHIALRHAMVLTVLQNICFLPVLPFVVTASIVFALIYDIAKFREMFITLQGIFMLLLFPITSFLIASVTRYWEYHADRMAAELVGKDKYIAALRCLQGSFFQHPNLLSTVSLTRSREIKEDWALSHPSLIQRINALRETTCNDG